MSKHETKHEDYRGLVITYDHGGYVIKNADTGEPQHAMNNGSADPLTQLQRAKVWIDSNMDEDNRLTFRSSRKLAVDSDKSVATVTA